MVIISVFYPKHRDSRFDHAYYIEKHIPLVRSRWTAFGLTNIELMRGKVGLDGSAPTYELIGRMTFTSVEAMQGALTSVEASEIMGDIAKFTDVQPVIQVNDPVRSS